RKNNSSQLAPFLVDVVGDRVALHYNRMEALGLLGDACFRAIEADGGRWISRCLGIRDLAGEHDSALDSLGKHCLTRLRMLVPPESLAGQERVPKPFEGDEGVAAAFCLGKSRAEFLHPGFEVRRSSRNLLGFVIEITFSRDTGSAL